VHPENADNKTVTWASSNPEVATITNNGLVTAIANGETTITVTTKDGKKTATCVVTVDYRAQWTGDWDFIVKKQPTSDTINYLGTISIGEPLLEENNFHIKIKYTEKDSVILEVDENGVLSGFKYSSSYGKFNKSDSVHIYLFFGTAGQMKFITHIIDGKKKKGDKNE